MRFFFRTFFLFAWVFFFFILKFSALTWYSSETNKLFDASRCRSSNKQKRRHTKKEDNQINDNNNCKREDWTTTKSTTVFPFFSWRKTNESFELNGGEMHKSVRGPYQKNSNKWPIFVQNNSRTIDVRGTQCPLFCSLCHWHCLLACLNNRYEKILFTFILLCLLHSPCWFVVDSKKKKRTEENIWLDAYTYCGFIIFYHDCCVPVIMFATLCND